jgi:SPP1 gp7 family putative phage head morphogenesis protein
MALAARLDLEPAEAVAFFTAKGEALSWDWQDVLREQQVKAFTVAKATSLDVLRTIRAEVAKAIGQGQTFEEFKRTLRPRLEALGWWGKAEVLDGDTGELTNAQLGSNRRLRTIYQTNVQTAYMAGRYQRYLANAAARPFWRYVATMDSRTRPTHAALNGKVWRFDDPIWSIIWPPNGWGCRCRVMALDQAEFDKLGVPLEDGSQMMTTKEVAVNKAGDTVTVRGVRYTDGGKDKVFWPDPGWDYNPGAAWAQHDPKAFAGEALGVGAVTEPARKMVKAMAGLKTWKDYGRPDLRAPELPRLPEPDLLPVAPSREAAAELMTNVLIGAGQSYRLVTTPVEDVVIRAELLPHLVEKLDNARERYANFVLPTLQTPLEVWATPYDDGTLRKRYIALFEGRNDLLVVVREARDGSLFWELYNAMQSDTKRLNKLREGALIYVRSGL